MEKVKKFGERLLLLREEHNETQLQLAEAIGITRQSLSRYEADERTPNIDLAYSIARHYGVSVDYLFGLSNVQTVDKDIKTACKVTGLSEKTIKEIEKYSDNAIEILSHMILNKNFSEMLDDIEKALSLNNNSCTLKTPKESFIMSSREAEIFFKQCAMEELRTIIEELREKYFIKDERIIVRPEYIGKVFDEVNQEGSKNGFNNTPKE